MHFESELWLPRPRDEVFAFFSNAANLEALTPPWLHFRILTAKPITMREGTVIDYRIRVHGIPITWQSAITVWDPPHRFLDAQRRGPYRQWVHTHSFDEASGGTTVGDSVEFLRRSGMNVLFDAEHNTRKPAFDHARLASALSKAAGGTYDGAHLPFMQIEFSADLKTVSFNAAGKHWNCDVQGNQCASDKAAAAGVGRGGARPLQVPSPDKKREAFIRDYNLWVRDVASGKETQLTTDGVKDFGYATDNAGWTSSERPILSWSPDSKKIATYQQDQRGAGEMYLVSTKVGHPELKYESCTVCFGAFFDAGEFREFKGGRGLPHFLKGLVGLS